MDSCSLLRLISVSEENEIVDPLDDGSYAMEVQDVYAFVCNCSLNSSGCR